MKEFVVTPITKRIEYATTDGKGKITGKREDVTSQILKVVNWWFVTSKNKHYSHELNDGLASYIFHTTDEDKANKIIKILERE